MKYKLIVQPSALADMDEAYRWIAKRSPESEQISQEIRQLLYGRRGGVYRALFVVRGHEVHVLHIRHAARNTLTPEEFSES